METQNSILIRPSEPEDDSGIQTLYLEAFETDEEAIIFQELRHSNLELISLVAEEECQIRGHILFSMVQHDPDSGMRITGLAPMAVLPGWQNQGIGSMLVQKGLEACRRQKFEAVVVLGHPRFYPRFGFIPSVEFGIRSEYDVSPEVFMILELKPGVLSGSPGTVKYHEVFDRI